MLDGAGNIIPKVLQKILFYINHYAASGINCPNGPGKASMD